MNFRNICPALVYKALDCNHLDFFVILQHNFFVFSVADKTVHLYMEPEQSRGRIYSS